jgi:chromosomal replication initiation ATPase DnaA
MFAMWFRVNHTRSSFAAIGSIYGKDHATVHHAVKTVINLMESNKPYRKMAISALNALHCAGYTKFTRQRK